MHTLIVLLALLFIGCGKPSGVAVTVTGLRSVPTFSSLRVTLTLDGVPSTDPPSDFNRADLTLDDVDTVRLGLDVKAHAQGRLRVTVAALPDGAFVLGQGMIDTDLNEGRS